MMFSRTLKSSIRTWSFLVLGIFGCFVLWSCSGAGDETDAESEQVQVPLTVKILALDGEVNSGLIQELGNPIAQKTKI